MMFKSLLFGLLLVVCAGCASGEVKLPDEYVRCQHVESGEVFKYEIEDAAIYNPMICSRNLRNPDGQCPTVYVIEDLEEVVRYYTNLEMLNWNCENINREGRGIQ